MEKNRFQFFFPFYLDSFFDFHYYVRANGLFTKRSQNANKTNRPSTSFGGCPSVGADSPARFRPPPPRVRWACSGTMPRFYKGEKKIFVFIGITRRSSLRRVSKFPAFPDDAHLSDIFFLSSRRMGKWKHFTKLNRNLNSWDQSTFIIMIS